jgi:phosphate transport system substrate-binding protein
MHEIANDAIVMIVNSQNSIDQLTLGQIRGIYNGTYTNWNQVGGADQAIVVVGRDSASGTREYFVEYVMKKENVTKKPEEFNSNGGVQQKVSQTPGAVGYVGLGFGAGVRELTLNVDGTPVAPTLDNITTKAYPIVRPLYMLTKGEPSGLAKEYLDFIKSAEGQEVVASADFIPVPK